jgi:hypothetical protein
MKTPESVGERIALALARDHGENWRQLISRHSDAWLRLANERLGDDEDADFYHGRLGALRVPALVIHGARDPRTEPGELDAIRAALPDAPFLVLPEGGHSPHSERATADAVTQAAAAFLSGLATLKAESPGSKPAPETGRAVGPRGEKRS